LSSGIENISRGRFAINLVNAWNRPELDKAGIGFPEHDARYAYGREWMSVVSRLMQGERLTYKGEHFDVRDYLLRPSSLYRPRPLIYVGGESEPARALVADHGDVWFINGQPPDDVRGLIADASSRPRTGAPLRFGLSAFVVARNTDREAAEEHARLLEILKQDAPLRRQMAANTDSRAVMFQTFAQHQPHVGSNGGTAAGFTARGAAGVFLVVPVAAGRRTTGTCAKAGGASGSGIRTGVVGGEARRGNCCPHGQTGLSIVASAMPMS